jgi:hypothetical protein
VAATPRYSTRADLPPLVEIGRDTVLTCPVYAAGALVAAVSATVTIYDDVGAVMDAGPAPPSGGIAECTVLAATTAGKAPSGLWRIVWEVTLAAGAPVSFRSTLYLVRYRLYPTIADADVGKRVPSLSLTFAGRPTIVSSYSDAIEEADTIVQRTLLEDARRPWLVCEPWSLREAWLCYAIAVIYEGLIVSSPDGEPYGDLAVSWRKRADDAFKAAKSTVDYDEDGAADGVGRQSARAPGTWLC